MITTIMTYTIIIITLILALVYAFAILRILNQFGKFLKEIDNELSKIRKENK